MTGIRIVAPFRPFPPESYLHMELQDFDWNEAIRMMAHSAELACQCPVSVITDVDSEVPIHAFKYVTHERRLMLWYLEAACCYLESDDFDRNTIMVDSDQLIYGDLSRWFEPSCDLGVLIRHDVKHQTIRDGQPLLNGVQFWAFQGKARLAPFFRRVLEVARTLDEDVLKWGADTVALLMKLEPIWVGIHRRPDLTINMIAAEKVIQALSRIHISRLRAGTFKQPIQPVLDFRWRRKRYMPAVYRATIASQVSA